MPTNRVVADTPPEHIPTAHQLIDERLVVLEDLTFQRGIERLRQCIVRTRAHRAHRLPDLKVPACLLERSGGVDAAVIGVEQRPGEASSLTGGCRQRTTTNDVRMWSAIAKPTNRREKLSMTVARYIFDPSDTGR